MASSSVNINLSAKIDLNLSISILMPSGRVVEVTGTSNATPMPENVALTEMLEETETLDTNLASINSEPVQCSSSESDSNKYVEGPLTKEAFLSLKNAFASIFDRPNSSLSTLSPSPRCSPASPSFSEINTDDLIWISLPEMELESPVVDCVIDDDGEMVVEIIPCESFLEDDEVVFLKEVNRSGTKKE